MNILKSRFVYLSISWIFIILSVFLLIFSKLNLWIDMTWGINMEYSYENTIDIEEIKQKIIESKDSILYKNESVINNISVYRVTWEKSIVVVAWFKTWIEEKTLNSLKSDFRTNIFEIIEQTDETVIETKYTNIWKSFWDYIKKTAILTLSIAIIAITIYVTYAFSWVVSWISVFSFAIITLVTLFHDVVISTWFYIFSWMFFIDFQIDTFFVTALLTILWYSINDTIVIFDRIRSNLKKYGWKKWKDWKDLYEIINISITQTLKRSIYTSLTLLFVLITIFSFWPETIKWFILVMIFWTIVGTYSSIFIASPILYQVNRNKKLSIYKKVVIKPEDKIVV